MFENYIGGDCDIMAEMTIDSDAFTDAYNIKGQSRAIASIIDDLVETGYSSASADRLFDMLQCMRHHCTSTGSGGDAKYTDWCEYRRILHVAIKACSWPGLEVEMAEHRLDFHSNLATADREIGLVEQERGLSRYVTVYQGYT